MAVISQIKVSSTTYDIKDTEGRKEAYLEWGGKNFTGGYGCIDAAMVDELGANRLMFAKAAGITIEYSRNNGSTWTDYGATNIQKIGLFSNGYSFALGKADSTNKATANGTNYQLRVTLATGAAGVYTALNKFVLYVSTNGSNNCTVTIDKALESTPTTWVNVVTDVPLTGWSGYNVINVGSITTYGNTASSQYGRIRFTFKANGGSTTYTGFQVSKIMGFGGVGWTTPSTMAKTGHLYSFDAGQNATFPAALTTNGVLYSVSNGNTLSMGSQNSNWCHIYSSANVPFIFNQDIAGMKTKILGSTDSEYHWYKLYLGGATAASNAINAATPLIEFSNTDRSQYLQLVYSDYDSVQGPDSLTLVGNQAGSYFIAPNIRTTGTGTGFKHRNISYGTGTPSGGIDGDVYIQY